MRLKPRTLKRIVLAVTVALPLALVAVFDVRVDQAEYPLDTWRMDLDDAAIGLGTILLGVAAIWTVYLKQEATDARVTKLAEQMNGGMSELARQHMQESEMITGILHRMDRFEDERDDCIEERRDLHERLIACMEGDTDDDRR